MQSKTAKLPKGQSYPLKPTALEAALANADINNAVDRRGWWATPYGPLVAVPPITYRLMVTAAL